MLSPITIFDMPILKQSIIKLIMKKQIIKEKKEEYVNYNLQAEK